MPNGRFRPSAFGMYRRRTVAGRTRACSQHVLDLFHEAIFSVLLDVCDRLSIDSRCTLVPFHSLPRFPENVTSPDPVIQRVKTPSRLPLGRLP